MYEIFKYAVVFTLVSIVIVTAIAPRTSRAYGEFCNSDRRDFYNGWRKDWPAYCGRQPSAQYLEDLKRDCTITKARIYYAIATGGVGEWSKNWGLHGEEKCLALEFGNEL